MELDAPVQRQWAHLCVMRLLPAMNVGGDKTHRRWSLVFDPMRSRAELGKNLAGSKLFRRTVVMVVGDNSGEYVNDCRVALVAVETDMAAWGDGRPTEPQFAIFDGVYFLGEIDCGKHRFRDPFIIRWRGMRSDRQAGHKEGHTDERPEDQ
jgi:hypothetical protein